MLLLLAFLDSVLDDDGNIENPVAAGSKFNALRFTYTAFIDVVGDTADGLGEDVPDVADVNDTAIDMAGGRIRISFPTGWAVSNKLVRVQATTDGTNADVSVGATIEGQIDTVVGILYQTDAMGTLNAAFTGAGAAAKAKAAAARVSLSATNITIDLGKEWGRNRDEAGRSLVIIFSDVQAGLQTGMFRSSSSARGANLRRLAANPSVTVGNILGSRTPAEVAEEKATPPVLHEDPLSRSVEITPTKVYPGEKKQRFTITFKAPGPMDGSTLLITIPEALQPHAGTARENPNNTGGDLFNTDNLHDGTAGISVLGRGGAKLVPGTVPSYSQSHN